MRLFVFSDVHGEAEALYKSLEDAGYDPRNPNHKLISLGDNFDRGEQSYDVYRFLKDHKAICIKGNHETFLEEALEKRTDGEFVLFNILHNGLDKTIQSLSGCKLQGYVGPSDLDGAIGIIDSRMLKWIKEMPLYFETKHYIFVHAGFNPNIPDWQHTDEHFMLWDIEYSSTPLTKVNKCVVFGHHHAFRVREQAKERGEKYTDKLPSGIVNFGCTDENRPVVIYNKIAIDPCSNLTKKVNVLVIEDDLLEEQKEEEIKKDTMIYVRSTDPETWNTVTMNYDTFHAYTYYDAGITINNNRI